MNALTAVGPGADQGTSGGLSTAVGAVGTSTGPPTPAFYRWGGWLGLTGVAHHVRVRKRLALGPRLTGELGLDMDLRTGATLRQAALTYELGKGTTSLAAIRVSPGGLHACRSLTLSLPGTRGSVAVRARGVAGVRWDGRPEFSVDVDDVRPLPLVALAATGALASGKALSAARPLASVTLCVPSLYDAWTARLDGRFVAQRTGGPDGGGLAVDVRELSFFLDV